MNVQDIPDPVGQWLTVDVVAEALDIPVTKVRKLVQERRILGVRRGAPATFQIPAQFLIPNQDGDDDAPAQTVLPSLHGTIVVLGDAGFDDPQIIDWLFTSAPELGERPIDALLAGRKSRVRQVAQGLG